MKCLPCNFASNDSEDLKGHYVDFHKVDRDIVFHQSIQETEQRFLSEEMFEMWWILDESLKVNHNFLVHYGAGRDAFEEKPVKYTCLGEIQKYEITFAQHSQDYDFYNAEKLVDDFLLNVKSRIRRST